jgi:hypothetical protein
MGLGDGCSASYPDSKPNQPRIIAMTKTLSQLSKAGGIALLLMVAGNVAASTLERLFAPKAELWSRWTAHQADDSRVIDHQPWDRFLQRYVESGADGVNRVAYGQVSAQDRAVLDRYIAGLAGLPITGYSREEQFAYWVNLYNALTVRVVIDHYPVESIRDIDISPGLFSDGPWGKELVEVEGEVVSLDAIEHRILRPIWRDARIHYAVNCASIGCPDLQPVAFTAENTEQLLNRAASAYVNHPRGVSVQADGLVLSSIYNWFSTDFASEGGVLEHIRRHAGTKLQGRLGEGAASAEYTYDWSLNDKSGAE